ncbi:RHS repeat-associated core domain-containing protein [Saprospira grandis]|uniref:Rhs family-like protein n=1 Tax=Saprospira grandis (strain Lewin) TaxID=984262 RepID=H6L0G7_SAPGL|nr:RHS repeat-associated core domain-containing protein [Saprospira grandis]AFC23397.1 Rhs family-like protein [Saprospira grandis str. Lewin]
MDELHLYGSARLGILKKALALRYRDESGTANWSIRTLAKTTLAQSSYQQLELGRRRYELSNHLGNVLATVSDKSLGQDSSQTGQADYYLAQVSSASLYYPFGWEMPGRKFVSGEEYRFGFNGVEKSPEISEGHNTTFFREMDARIGRWWSNDPVFQPHQSPYNMMDGNPIMYSDPRGDKIKWDKKSLGKKGVKSLKAGVRKLKRKSKTFRKIWKDLKKSKHVHTIKDFNANPQGQNMVEVQDNNYSEKGVATTIYLNPSSKIDDIGYEKTQRIAHELAHVWRADQGLEAESMKDGGDQLFFDSPLAAGRAALYDSYTRKHKIIREYEALHIENIIRGEMGEKIRPKYGEMADMPSTAIETNESFGKKKYVVGISQIRFLEVKAKNHYDYKTKNPDSYKLLRKRGFKKEDIPVTSYLSQEYLDNRK